MFAEDFLSHKRTGRGVEVKEAWRIYVTVDSTVERVVILLSS